VRVRAILRNGPKRGIGLWLNEPYPELYFPRLLPPECRQKPDVHEMPFYWRYIAIRKYMRRGGSNLTVIYRFKKEDTNEPNS